MREMGLQSRGGAKFKPATTRANQAHPVDPNHLDRDFTAEAPNRKWVPQTAEKTVVTIFLNRERTALANVAR